MTEEWRRLKPADLLPWKLADLRLQIQGSWVEPQIEIVRKEMSKQGLCFRPHFWFSDEWFSPVGIPGVAIPFYLAHPKLIQLERQQMLEAEGGSPAECKRLLRHEIGHAIQHAYELHRRPRWQRLFGKASEPYPEHYAPDPNSRDYVHHLDSWYAQSHPSEDFAETFAVWLSPRSRWRQRYAGWPALQKLEFIHELMREVGAQPARARSRSRSRPGALSTLRHSLQTHYDRKRTHYAVGDPTAYDRDLLRLFSNAGADVGDSAAAFLRQNRRAIRESVARWTGENLFAVDQVLKEFILRCLELKLRAVGSQHTLQMDAALVLAVHTLSLLHLRRPHWVAV